MYTTRTVIVWVVKGSLGRTDAKQLAQLAQMKEHSVMRFSVEKLQCLMQEDHRALDIIKQIAKLRDGHYKIKWPYHVEITLHPPPDRQKNKPLAEHRLGLLKKILKIAYIVIKDAFIVHRGVR